jgi:hypothetical protein
MTANTTEEFRAIGPVLLLALLIIPVIMNGYLMVYSLAGWVLTGRDQLNWMQKAEPLALWMGAGIVFWCVLVMLLVRRIGAGRAHILLVSSVGHVVVACLSMASIFVTTRL